MREALELQIAGLRRAVVEQQHGAVTAGEELLETENLPAVAQRLAREQPHLGQRVEDDAGGADALHLGEHRFGRLAELDLRGMEKSVLVVGLEAFLGGRQFVDVHALEAADDANAA